MTQRSTVVGVFEDQRQARQAVEELRRAGFRDDQIGVAARDREARRDVEGKTETYAEEGAVTGVVAGAAAGGLWGIAIAAGLLPAIGPVIAGGTLAAILASAATGAAVAGIVGALIGLGIPEEEARYYETEFKAGRIIVTVKADGRSSEALAILRRFGAYDVTTPRMTRESTAATAMGGEAGQSMQLREEELHAHKQPVHAGEVRVRKEVHTEHRTVDVPVSHEEVVVERHPVAGGRASASEIRAGEEIRIPVKEEQVHVEKRPVVKEEVRVSKRQVQDTEHVSGTVRKEEAKIEKEGDVKVCDTDAGKSTRSRR
jgi:uncharacterized protein (TIGR02271 family)